jgi:hypothetical protein
MLLRSKYTAALIVTALLLGACDSPKKAALVPATQSLPVAKNEAPQEYRFADFEEGFVQLIPPGSPEAKVRNAKTTALATKQGARTDAGSYAERSGDDYIDHSKSSVVQGIASIIGTLSKKNGSAYGGILLITPSGKPEGLDLSEFRTIRLTLGSLGHHTTLQVRITGMDDQAVFRGCYPVHTVTVTSDPREYAIPLTDENFPQLPWCKDLSLPIGQTLKAVRTVDVQDINMPEKPKGETRVEFLTGSIRFTQ